MLKLKIAQDFLTRMLAKIYVDRMVFFGLLLKIWTVLSAPVTILLIATKFSPEVQGYYYTFANLLNLQVFIELGLGTVIIQFASHEWSRLRLDTEGYITGEEGALSRLVSLARLSVRWYAIGAVIAAIGLITGGHFFFSRSPASDVSWKMPWFSLCLATGGSILLLPVWSLLEGCNQLSRLYAYRFFQSLFSCIFLWVAIFSGAKLWASSVPVAAALICAGWFLTKKYKNFLKTLAGKDRSIGQRILWRKEILPMQWRIAVSWMSGYFAFYLFTPALFKFQGPVVAGQFGMTWSIIGIITGVAWAWFAPKIPRFGMLIAQKDYKTLDRLFWHTTKITVAVASITAAAILSMFYFLVKIKHPIAGRLLPVLPASIFLLSNFLLFLSMPFSAYLRAHKKEPILFVSIASGVLVGLSILFLGRKYGAMGMSLGYLAVNLIMLPIIIIIWLYCRAEWHKEAV